MARVIHFYAQGRKSNGSSANPYAIRMMGRGDSTIITSGCIILSVRYELVHIGYNRVVLANPEDTTEALLFDDVNEAKKIANEINNLAGKLNRWDLDTYIGCLKRSAFREALAKSIQT